MTTKKRTVPADGSQSSYELVIQCWQDMGRPPVSSRLLADIQTEIAKKLEGSHQESPASIARMLADEGAELRHPEIIESDAEWREKQIQGHAKEFADIEQWIARSPLSLQQTEEFITTLEDRRQEFESGGVRSGVEKLRSIVIEARQNAQALATNHRLDVKVRAEQTEIADWLKVWLQTPALFKDWLELRIRSDDFRERFLAEAP